MYVIICKENSQEVEKIIQDPSEEQKKLGIVVDSLLQPHLFQSFDNVLYLIKKKEND